MLAHSPRIVTENLVLLLDAANPRNFDLTKVEVLVVAGGGGGGGEQETPAGGGGGAGGLIYYSSYPVTPGTQLTATVGDGGAGGIGRAVGSNGGNSVFGALTAIGGGGGGFYSGLPSSGGSGGGAGWTSVVTSGGSGTAGQGFAGGSVNQGNTPFQGAAGGGGAGGAGGDSIVRNGGAGGVGLQFTISGTSTYYAGGGGGGGGYGDATPGTGAIGGSNVGGSGGNAAAGGTVGSPGVTNSGGGGGGAGADDASVYIQKSGGAGGSGIIIVRYPGPQKAIGGTITSVGGDTIHTFTTSGTFTPLVNTNGSAVLGLSDLSGNRNFGTTANGPTYNSANGGSLVFDGSNDYATIEANSSFQLGNGYTLCAWVKASNNPGNYAGICGTFDRIPSSYFGQNFAILPGSQRFSFVVSGWSGGSLQYIDATTQYTIGRWYYLVGTNLGVNCNFYIDGNLDTTYTQAAVASNPGPTTKFKIGRYYQDDANYYFPGNIADIKYYNRALSAAEVSQNYNALRFRFGL